MRLVFAGTPVAALPSLQALVESSRHQVCAVLTRPDAEVGRGRRVRRSPVASFADEHGIEVLTPRRVGDPDFLARVTEVAPDCCPVVAYGALLPQSALDIPRYGWVNLHFSLLPAWRGAAPVQAAVAAGDEITGATTFRIVRELDAGPIFGMLTEPIGDSDTAGELLDRLAVAGSRLLMSTMDGIEDGTLEARPQPVDGVSYAGKVSADDARVDFTMPARTVDRLIRSVTPEPGAWAVFRGDRLKLFRASVTIDDPLPPGELVIRRSEVLVGTADTPVRLDQVQPSGKKRMTAADWARGARLELGERLT